MQRIKLLLLFGGESAEHEISISSARNVYAALDDQKYDITLGYITKNGRWYLTDSIDAAADAENHELLPALGTKNFMLRPGDRRLEIDVILPILHGTNGEDGSVQGLAQLLHIPLVGCGVLGSAICMDKEVTKRLLEQAKIPVVPYRLHHRSEPIPDFAHLTIELGNPLFIKPDNLGSSVGVNKVTTKQEFEAALDEAGGYGNKILIEQAISGRELECAVLGNEKPEASVVGEIKPDDEFYSYDAKYDQTSESKVIVPADLPTETADNIRELSIKAYKTLECRGLARVDFFLADDGKIYINELNTLPGFTNISMYPKLWRENGLHYPALIDRLVQLALGNK